LPIIKIERVKKECKNMSYDELTVPNVPAAAYNLINTEVGKTKYPWDEEGVPEDIRGYYEIDSRIEGYCSLGDGDVVIVCGGADNSDSAIDPRNGQPTLSVPTLFFTNSAMGYMGPNSIGKESLLLAPIIGSKQWHPLKPDNEWHSNGCCIGDLHEGVFDRYYEVCYTAILVFFGSRPSSCGGHE